MATYSELLKDPRWQRKRLEILNRDNFTCKCCGAKESTLHVHHFKYLKGNMPWEYPDSNFITMCYECHYEEEQFIKCQNEGFVKINRLYNIPIRKMWHISFVLSYMMTHHPEIWEKLKADINVVLSDYTEDFRKEWDKYHG